MEEAEEGGCGRQKAGKEEEKKEEGKKGRRGERVDKSVQHIGGQGTEWVASYVQWMDR